MNQAWDSVSFRGHQQAPTMVADLKNSHVSAPETVTKAMHSHAEYKWRALHYSCYVE